MCWFAGYLTVSVAGNRMLKMYSHGCINLYFSIVKAIPFPLKSVPLFLNKPQKMSFRVLLRVFLLFLYKMQKPCIRLQLI